MSFKEILESFFNFETTSFWYYVGFCNWLKPYFDGKMDSDKKAGNKYSFMLSFNFQY